MTTKLDEIYDDINCMDPKDTSQLLNILMALVEEMQRLEKQLETKRQSIRRDWPGFSIDDSPDNQT